VSRSTEAYPVFPDLFFLFWCFGRLVPVWEPGGLFFLPFFLVSFGISGVFCGGWVFICFGDFSVFGGREILGGPPRFGQTDQQGDFVSLVVSMVPFFGAFFVSAKNNLGCWGP